MKTPQTAFTIGPARAPATVDRLRVATALDAHHQTSDLSDLEHCTQLRVLNLARVRTVKLDLGPLEYVADTLEELTIFGPYVVDFGALSSLRMLQKLGLYRTQILDLKPLLSCLSLEHLSIAETRIDSVEFLSSLTRLSSLNMNDTLVEDLGPLARHRLFTLRAQGSRVRELAPLEHMTTLHVLELGSSRVQNLDSLMGAMALRTLHLGRTAVYDLEPLACLPELKRLDIHSTAVTNLLPLAELTRLRRLDVTGLELARKDVDWLRDTLPECLIVWEGEG